MSEFVSEFYWRSARGVLENVRDALQYACGWKGRNIPYEFSTVFGFYPQIEEDELRLKEGGRTVLRFTHKGVGGAELSGPWVDRLDGDAGTLMKADLLRRVVTSCLSFRNIASIRRQTVGCAEAIPFVTVPGDDPRRPRRCYFFPEDRWDIRQVLLRGGAFMERDIRDREAFEREFFGEHRPSVPHAEPAVRAEKGAVLFDGRAVWPLREGYRMSNYFDERENDDVYAERMEWATKAAAELKRKLYDEALGPLVERGDLSEAEARSFSAGRGYEVRRLSTRRSGDGGVFLFRDNSPVWGVYMNSGGSLTVSPDGAGYRCYPSAAPWHDTEKERMMQGEDDVKGMVYEAVSSRLLSEENVRTVADAAREYVLSRGRAAVVTPSPNPGMCAESLGADVQYPVRAWLPDRGAWVLGEQRGGSLEYWDHDDLMSVPLPLHTYRYTGFRDAEGRRIWEGDTVSVDGLSAEVFESEDTGRFVVRFEGQDGQRVDEALERYEGTGLTVVDTPFVEERQAPKSHLHR